MLLLHICAYVFSDVIIDFDNKPRFMMNEGGDITVDKINELDNVIPSNDDLIFDYNSVPVASISNENSTLKLKNTYETNILPADMPLEGFQMSHDLHGTLAEISDEGNFFSTEKNKTLLSAVTYVDGYAVYDNLGINAKTSYFNFNTENGVEGRIIDPEKSGESEFYLKDHLGSVRSVIKKVDNKTSSVQTMAYHPYGSKINFDVGSGLNVCETFTGKELDTEGADDNDEGGIQAYHFGARYYDPRLGIWFSPDIALQFWSPYSYHTNPILYTDPDGNFAGLGTFLGMVGNTIGAGLRNLEQDKQFYDGLTSTLAVSVASMWTSNLTHHMKFNTGTKTRGAIGPATKEILAGIFENTSTVVAQGLINETWKGMEEDLEVPWLPDIIINGVLSGAASGRVSILSSSISDRFIARRNYGPIRSTFTEIGISAFAGGASNMLIQLIPSATNYKFSWVSVLNSSLVGVKSSSFRIAKFGYLTNSITAANEIFVGEQGRAALKRFCKHMPDPTKHRFKQYREGGVWLLRPGRNSTTQGVTWAEKNKKSFNTTSVYAISNFMNGKRDLEKDPLIRMKTFVHEVSHGGQYTEDQAPGYVSDGNAPSKLLLRLNTTDKGLINNAYGFETAIVQDGSIVQDESGYFWKDGVPYNNDEATVPVNAPYTKW